MKTAAAKRQNRDTVGKISYEFMKKDTQPINLKDLSGEMNAKKDKMQMIWDAVADGKRLYTGDFYVVFLKKKELLSPNTLHNYFFPRKSCPTPTYHQSIFKYYRKEERLDLLWTLPSQEGVQFYLENKTSIPPDKMSVLKYVLDFWDGTLDRLTQKENKETFYDPSLEYR